MRIQCFVAAMTLVAFSLVSQGCLQTCSRLCEENTNYVDGCLESWDAQWSELGFDGQVLQGEGDAAQLVAHDGGPGGEYMDTCLARYSAAIGASSVDDQYMIRDGCATDLQALAASVGCNDYTPNDVDLDPNGT